MATNLLCLKPFAVGLQSNKLSGLILGPLGIVVHHKTITLPLAQLAGTAHVTQKSKLPWR